MCNDFCRCRCRHRYSHRFFTVGIIDRREIKISKGNEWKSYDLHKSIFTCCQRTSTKKEKKASKQVNQQSDRTALTDSNNNNNHICKVTVVAAAAANHAVWLHSLNSKWVYLYTHTFIKMSARVKYTIAYSIKYGEPQNYIEYTLLHCTLTTQTHTHTVYFMHVTWIVIKYYWYTYVFIQLVQRIKCEEKMIIKKKQQAFVCNVFLVCSTPKIDTQVCMGSLHWWMW